MPTKLKIFNQIDGWADLSRNFPVTSLKLKIAIIGAIPKERTVAKSTKSLRFPANCKTITKDPIKSKPKSAPARVDWTR